MTRGFQFFLIMGVAPSAYFFLMHSLGCRYDMNPLCFFRCLSPAILCLPVLFFDDLD